MKKRLIPLLLALMLALSVNAGAQSIEPDEESPAPFVRSRTYADNFADVSANSWYASSVSALYEYGLSDGRSSGRFDPNGTVTVAELITFSARLASTYTLGDPEAGAKSTGVSGAWYAPYAAYLKSIGALDESLDGQYARAATRAQMAGILAASLPEERYDARNADAVTEGYAMHQYITDVNDYTPYQPQILWLYKQGIAGGSDSTGSFRPDDTVKRSEVAAMLTRMVDPSLRLTLYWPVVLYRSAVGTSWSDLTAAPESTTAAPDVNDTEAIDALLRQMLHDGSSTISLSYPKGLTQEDAAQLARSFTSGVKRYCEQMYNAVTCRAYSTGRVYLTFSSTACDAQQLSEYRSAALSRAIAIHDSLWRSGYLTGEMSEYELARAYFIWLCENCAYDNGVVTDSSVSHLAYGALVNGVAVCDGYTGAYNLLLRLEGIECTSLFNADHIWTVATLDGTSYHIDTTWGDQPTVADTSFFGMTEEQSRAKHAW